MFKKEIFAFGHIEVKRVENRPIATQQRLCTKPIFSHADDNTTYSFKKSIVDIIIIARVVRKKYFNVFFTIKRSKTQINSI